MSTWRRKAIECLPELKRDFEQPDTSIYSVFFELLPAAVAAHKQNDTVKLERIYSFAEWCFGQKEKELWNAAGVAFYEHLGDYEETSREISKWVKRDVYRDIRGLLEWRLDKDAFIKIDKSYS